MPYKDRAKQNAYQLRRLRRRREAWFKQNGPCVDCGTWQDLELDHVNAATKAEHRVWSWSAPRRGAELRKCVARCHDCHERKTYAASEYQTPVGERNGSAVLTEWDVREIRNLLAGGLTFQALADRFMVHRITIMQACRRRTWRHVM